MKSVFSVSRCWVALAMPKSITLGTGLPSCCVTITLVGLMSRWMIPFWWACWTALADVDEQLQTLLGGQVVLIAVLGDGHALGASQNDARYPGKVTIYYPLHPFHGGDELAVHRRFGSGRVEQLEVANRRSATARTRLDDQSRPLPADVDGC